MIWHKRVVVTNWARRVRAPVLALAVLLCATRVARAEPKNQQNLRVGVLIVTALGVTAEKAEAIGETFRRALGQMLFVDVATASEVGSMLATPISETCIGDAPCIREVGRKLDVKELVFLAIIRVGDSIQINITWANAITGDTEPRYPISIDDETRQAEMFAELAPALLPGARRRPRPSAPAPAVTPTTGDTTAARGQGRHLTGAAWVTGGLTVLALASGGTFAFLALQTRNDLDGMDCANEPAGCPKDDVDRLETRSLVADASFAVAVIAGVTTAILYWRSGGDEHKTTIDVAATEGSMKLLLTRRF